VTSALRGRLFLLAGAGLLVFLLIAYAGLPDFGANHSALGAFVNREAIPERSITASVTAVNFEYRAFDTFGEEFILFTAVIGVAALLRKARDEQEDAPDDDAPGRQVRATSVAVGLAGLALVGPTVLVGLYVVAHGHQTPGGGFQGGVILASALLITYLCDRYRTMRRVGPAALVELGEGIGTFALALIGLAGLIWGGAFFTNVLGKGRPGELLSAGTVPLSNGAVGLAVAGGFSLLLSEFLEQTLVLRRRARARREGDAA
jgi:multicomponent Na+:H+ antiporter subunit B